MDYSKFMFGGRLVRDPETKETKAGPVTRVTVAVNRKAGGEDFASFFDIEGWDKMSDRLASLAKGQLAFFEGDIFQKEYTPKDADKPRRITSFKCFNMRYLSKPGETAPAKSDDSEEDVPW